MASTTPSAKKKHLRFKWLAMGLGLVLGLAAGIGVLQYYQQQQAPQFFGNYRLEGFEPHPYLGYAPKHNTTIHSCKVAGGDTVYCARYTIDAHGRRQLPINPAASEHLLLFGCSFAYGEGVNDNENLAYNLAAALPGHQVYNYAYSGYGPQQMLARWQFGDIGNQVPQQEGTAIYLLLPEHVHRAAASNYYLQGWGAQSPHYALVEDSLVYYANHYAWRPIHTAWHRFLGWAGIAGLFGRPNTAYSTDDLALTAAILQASKQHYLTAYPQGKFMVAVPPLATDDGLYEDLASVLTLAGIEVIDVRHAYPAEPLYTIPGDGHPSALGHRLLAERLISHLRLD